MTGIHRQRPAGCKVAALGIIAAMLLSACAMQAPRQPSATPRVVERPVEAPALTPQMAAAADTLTKMAGLQDRLYKVAAPLLIQNAELCKGQARNLLGFTAKNRWSYPGEYNEA